jgi:predicted TIM-barrel fold metal-dependent hydrolase
VGGEVTPERSASTVHRVETRMERGGRVTTTFLPSSEVRQIKARLNHPVIDGDGHLLEVAPLVVDFVREAAGTEVAQRFERFDTPRAKVRSVRNQGLPALATTRDGMTVTLPELLHQRLDELGFDFIVLYPSIGLLVLTCPDAEVRQAAAFALNRYYAEVFADYRDRFSPVAVIPTFTPEEAVAELDHAVGTLGLRGVVMNGVVPRHARADGSPDDWLDTLGHGSPYDYDPVWSKCVELGVAPTFHGTGNGWGTRNSVTNYTYNHVGHFGAAQEGVCRSFVMGGVARRFPTLQCGFLEGGVSWACQLFADLIGHHSKRSQAALIEAGRNVLAPEESIALLRQYGTEPVTPYQAELERSLRAAAEARAGRPEPFDEFAEARITSPSDIVEVFTKQFTFGCEADDPLTALAFDRGKLPHGARLNAMLGSDIGHWDVPDVRGVLPEAWELVEHGHLDEEEFRDFACGNLVRMLTAMNPRFFEGTAVEDDVRKLVGL